MRNYEKVLVTEDNIDEIKWEICCDQADEVEVGMTISTYAIFYEPGHQRGQMTIFHDTGRGAINFGADSDWGDWDDERGILTLDDAGQEYNTNGEWINEDEFEDEDFIGGHY